jgi:hypothetical protein
MRILIKCPWLSSADDTSDNVCLSLGLCAQTSEGWVCSSCFRGVPSQKQAAVTGVLSFHSVLISNAWITRPLSYNRKAKLQKVYNPHTDGGKAHVPVPRSLPEDSNGTAQPDFDKLG